MPHWLQLMLDSLGPLLWAGLVFTIPLTLSSFVLGLSLGLISALIRLFGPRPLAAIVRFYVWIIRGTPLLVQLFLIFYGLPSVGIVLDAFPAALIYLAISSVLSALQARLETRLSRYGGFMEARS